MSFEERKAEEKDRGQRFLSGFLSKSFGFSGPASSEDGD